MHLVDLLPKDIQLIVYRYVFDYDYSRVKEEYHGNNPHDAIEYGSWNNSIIYGDFYINRRDLSRSSKLANHRFGNHGYDYGNTEICKFNFRRLNCYFMVSNRVLSPNYYHCVLPREYF